MAISALKELIEASEPDPNPPQWEGKESLRVAPDGLPAREVKAHNADKAHYIGGYSEIFAKAMKNKWGHRCYVDLFCGPGVCWVKDTGRFVLGSPLLALNVNTPFTHIVLNDLNDDCMRALETRMVDTEADRLLLTGNANDRSLLDEIRAFIPSRHALSLALLDPQGLDLELETIRYLTTGIRMDLLINFPVHSFYRCLCAGDTDVLDKVLGPDWPLRTSGPLWKAAVREHFHRRLVSMGYDHHEAKQVWSVAKNSPLYDFILYSRVELAIKFFKSATRTNAAGQEPFPLLA